MIPGEILPAKGDIELNAGRKTITLEVANTGDRPIQVGSHYHFFETNPALRFDRKATRGFRLDIAAGTAVRFEPGQRREVALVSLGGRREVYGFRGEVMGRMEGKGRKARARAGGNDYGPPYLPASISKLDRQMIETQRQLRTAPDHPRRAPRSARSQVRAKTDRRRGA